jgi:hypothetical protein
VSLVSRGLGSPNLITRGLGAFDFIAPVRRWVVRVVLVSLITQRILFRSDL